MADDKSKESLSEWHSPPENPVLGKDEVHVWRAELDIESPRLQSLLEMLSDDERSRAQRFAFQRHRKRFITSHGLLRIILSRYLEMEPRQLSFSYGTHGKPELIQERKGDEIRFNMSHSQELALYAFTRRRAVGIDLELIKPNLACDEIAEQFFSTREVYVLRSLPHPVQRKAFFKCWTHKEAYIKAAGKGLSIPLDQFEVSFAPGEPAKLLKTEWDAEEASRWFLQTLNIGSDYAAALAVEGGAIPIRCFDFQKM